MLMDGIDIDLEIQTDETCGRCGRPAASTLVFPDGRYPLCSRHEPFWAASKRVSEAWDDAFEQMKVVFREDTERIKGWASRVRQLGN